MNRPSMSGGPAASHPRPLLTPGRGGPGTLATVSTPTDPAAVVGRFPAPAPRTLTTAEAITAATAVLDAHVAGTPQEQADAVRSWWLGNFGSDGRPPCAFAVLSLVLPAPPSPSRSRRTSTRPPHRSSGQRPNRDVSTRGVASPRRTDNTPRRDHRRTRLSVSHPMTGVMRCQWTAL